MATAWKNKLKSTVRVHEVNSSNTNAQYGVNGLVFYQEYENIFKGIFKYLFYLLVKNNLFLSFKFLRTKNRLGWILLTVYRQIQNTTI